MRTLVCAYANPIRTGVAKRSKWILILLWHNNQLAQAYLQKQRYDEAVGRAQNSGPAIWGSPAFIANLARAYVVSGKRTEAVKLLGDLKKRSNPGYSKCFGDCRDLCISRDTDQAMNWLEKRLRGAIQSGRPAAAGLRSSPLRSAIPESCAPHWPTRMRFA